MITSNNLAAWHSGSSPASPVRTWKSQCASPALIKQVQINKWHELTNSNTKTRSSPVPNIISVHTVVSNVKEHISTNTGHLQPTTLILHNPSVQDFDRLRQVLINQRCHMAGSVSPAAVQITLSPIKLHLHSAITLCSKNEAPLQIFCVFYAYTKFL